MSTQFRYEFSMAEFHKRELEINRELYDKVRIKRHKMFMDACKLKNPVEQFESVVKIALLENQMDDYNNRVIYHERKLREG